MTKEKKYVLAGTDEEVLLGDVISQTLVKDFDEGRRIKRQIEFKLTEETLPYALEMGVIEEVEEEKEEQEELLDFGEEDECPYSELIDEIVEDQEELEKRMDSLEDTVEAQDKMLNAMMKDLKNCIEQVRKAIKEEKTASSKKK